MRLLLSSLTIAFLSLFLSSCYDPGYYGGGYRPGYHVGNAVRSYGGPVWRQVDYRGPRYHQKSRVNQKAVNQARNKKKQWRKKARKRR